MKYFISILIIIAALGIGMQVGTKKACGQDCDSALPLATSLNPEQFAQFIASKEVSIIDVRTPEEFASGFIQSATNQDFYQQRQFVEYLDALDRHVPYAIYCRSGNRSNQTVTLMQQMGFTDVHHLDGGIQAWQRSGYPIAQ